MRAILQAISPEFAHNNMNLHIAIRLSVKLLNFSKNMVTGKISYTLMYDNH